MFQAIHSWNCGEMPLTGGKLQHLIDAATFYIIHLRVGVLYFKEFRLKEEEKTPSVTKARVFISLSMSV